MERGNYFKKPGKEVGEISCSNIAAADGGICKGRKGFMLGMIRRRSRPGNTPARKPFFDGRFTEPVLKFLGNTEVGKVKQGVLLKWPGVVGRSPLSHVFPFLFLLLFRVFFSFRHMLVCYRGCAP